MDFLYRTQEWLADRVRWIQYPNVRKVVRKPDWQPYRDSAIVQIDRNSDKTRLSWGGAVLLLMYAALALVIAVPVIVIGCIIVWSAISSLF
ncbi:hypothetical protein ACKZDW_07870 [Ralstonia syzygii subsp. celebesensis]|uniref:Uncharacterized protein n=2 Tax=Ralstonia syzygii subsp. celebesensis TaxID=1310168 RepID=A0A1U9VDB1_9RALS|nr:hypothetical protein [Ralstonia syzygii]AQW28639.1 hypothetical protein B0B51_00435 [blood disease bacterium A2-HR MARDI]CCA82202.1 conserved hypothetical protein [blood disease bacterium R229]